MMLFMQIQLGTLKHILKKVMEGEVILISSKLLDFEVANALRFGTKYKEKSLDVWNDFVSLPIKKYVLTKKEFAEVIRHSYLNNTTVYDTSYHLLAISKGAKFLTCDSEYFKKAESLGSIELFS